MWSRRRLISAVLSLRSSGWSEFSQVVDYRVSGGPLGAE